MIVIEIVTGSAFVETEDKFRAQVAAEEFLAKAGIPEKAAEYEYQRQWEEFDVEDPMTGLALAWIEARRAADVALTQGWGDPDGASCEIVAA